MYMYIYIPERGPIPQHQDTVGLTRRRKIVGQQAQQSEETNPKKCIRLHA